MRRLTCLTALVVVLAIVSGTGSPRVFAQSGALAGGSQTPAAAPAPAGTGLLMGRVVDATTGAAIPEAFVSADPGGLVARINAGIAAPADRSRVMTDNDGRFVIRDLAPQSYTVVATETAYMGGGFDQLRPGGQPQAIDLARTPLVGDIVIRMWKLAAITGTVTDEHGEPSVGTNVRVLRRVYSAGQSRFATGRTVQTDDRGVYRLSLLEPGEYIVFVPTTITTIPVSVAAAFRSAMNASADQAAFLTETLSSRAPFPGSAGTLAGDFLISDSGRGSGAGLAVDGSVTGHQTLFYPASTTADRATTIVVAAGQERANVDLQLKRVQMFRVSGSVAGPSGPVPGVGVHLVPDGTLVVDVDTATTITDAQGAFTFLGVPSGQYTVQVTQVPRAGAQRTTTMITSGNGGVSTVTTMSILDDGSVPSDTSPALAGEAPVVVGDADVTGVALSLAAAAHVAGSVKFDTATPPTPQQISRMIVSFQPVESRVGVNFASGRLDANAQFSAPNLFHARYRIAVRSLPAGWTIESALVNGVDIVDTGVDVSASLTGLVVTVTDRSTSLTGTVRDGMGQPDTRADVCVFSANRASWTDSGANPQRISLTRASQTGSFAVTTLPPGDYLIAAVSDDAVENWPSAATLERIAGAATPVHLGDGEKKTQDLRTITIH